MTGLVEMVRAEVNDECLEFRKHEKYEKDGCGISLKDAPEPRLAIDFDKQGSPLGKNQPRCDYLFVMDAGDKGCWIVPLELKSGKYDASNVIRQLKAGTRVAEDLVPERTKVRFRPVLVFGKAPHKNEREKLKRTGKVSFHGDTQFIRLTKCGGKLAEKL